MDFLPTTLSAISASLLQGETTCVSLVEHSLSAIAASHNEINAFITTQSDAALARAKQLDSLSTTEKQSLPLFGVPVAVKDNICTKGLKTTCGSKMLANFIPPYNATVVEALEKAGAIIVGKTNLDEFAMGSTTESSFFGATKNPLDTTRIPGGSSGGSAAAVAAHTVPLSLGSDTGGSIRQPSSHCGIAGLKPTYGRVSRYGLVAFASSLDQIGPMAHDVVDLGTALSVISEADTRDSTHARKQFSIAPESYTQKLNTMVVGIPQEYFAEGLSETVRTAVNNTIEALKVNGISFIPISLPNLSYAVATYYIICTAEASSNLSRYDGVKYGLRASGATSLQQMYTKTRAEGFGAEVKRRIMLGTYVLSAGYYDAYYLKAARVRTLIANDFNEAFKQCQAIVAPTAPSAAFKFGEKENDPLALYLADIYTVSANLSGIPAITVPIKNASSPIGIQFMAPRWNEETLLRLGYAVQNIPRI